MLPGVLYCQDGGEFLPALELPSRQIFALWQLEFRCRRRLLQRGMSALHVFSARAMKMMESELVAIIDELVRDTAVRGL